MNVVGPELYKLTCSPTEYEVECQHGHRKFSGHANTKQPKLYVVSVDNRPIYVGLSRRLMRERFWTGWNSTGKRGYHGYKFRHKITSADLAVWTCLDRIDPKARDMEAIEAEVVFNVRAKTEQWPESQTEIHFQQSTPIHRKIAAEISGHFGL
ncbi:hypothetical protein AB8A05_29620 [Tardiphaga sp. 538_B7_N1_4]|uniref:hypothetical protein n=1 Tax=Tardiphaga sp. 538_B7_N1_4 TaxID=3240778 RepID=UPI003F1FEE55